MYLLKFVNLSFFYYPLFSVCFYIYFSYQWFSEIVIKIDSLAFSTKLNFKLLVILSIFLSIVYFYFCTFKFYDHAKAITTTKLADSATAVVVTPCCCFRCCSCFIKKPLSRFVTFKSGKVKLMMRTLKWRLNEVNAARNW